MDEEPYSPLFYVMLGIGLTGVLGFFLLGGALGAGW